jgi:hypothetical protein
MEIKINVEQEEMIADNAAGHKKTATVKCVVSCYLPLIDSSSSLDKSDHSVS